MVHGRSRRGHSSETLFLLSFSRSHPTKLLFSAHLGIRPDGRQCPKSVFLLFQPISFSFACETNPAGTGEAVTTLCHGRSYGHKCLLTQCLCTHIRMHTRDPQSLTSMYWIPTWLLKGLLETCVIYFSLGLKIKRDRTSYLVIDSGFRAWFDSWELFSWLPPIYLTQYLLFKEYKVILISIVASYPPL